MIFVFHFNICTQNIKMRTKKNLFSIASIYYISIMKKNYLTIKVNVNFFSDKILDLVERERENERDHLEEGSKYTNNVVEYTVRMHLRGFYYYLQNKNTPTTVLILSL